MCMSTKHKAICVHRDVLECCWVMKLFHTNTKHEKHTFKLFQNNEEIDKPKQDKDYQGWEGGFVQKHCDR